MNIYGKIRDSVITFNPSFKELLEFSNFTTLGEYPLIFKLSCRYEDLF